MGGLFTRPNRDKVRHARAGGLPMNVYQKEG